MLLKSPFGSRLPANKANQSVRSPHFFALDGGRTLAYECVGDPQGRPVFFFHGSPGSRLDVLSAAEAAQKHGWRIIAPDRPGMGQSGFKSGYTLLDYTDDIRQLADGLGFKSFGVMGHSGGGTTVLSCAYALADRLEFALDLGGWGPVTVPALRSRMTALDQFFMARVLREPQIKVPALFGVLFAGVGMAAKILPPQRFVGLLNHSNYFCAADQALLSDPGMANALVESVRESFHQGSEGPAYDALLRYQDWGFELEQVKAPVQIFHGDDDVSAPYFFAEYKDQKLPHSQLHVFSGEGHFFLWSHWEEIMAIAGA